MSKILVVDDDDDLRVMLRWAFEAQGHQVVEARDGREAMRLCRDHAFELVILDILMPVKDGLECLCELRRSGYSAPIIAMSGSDYRASDMLHVARNLGARRTFSKPFELGMMIAAVAEELRRGRET